MNFTRRSALACLAMLALSASVTRTATAELLINEIFFDPPGNGAFGDDTREYIELRGTPGMSLNNHYLLFLENEDNSAGTGDPGQIEMFFDLSGRTLSPTGFFSMRQKGDPYTSVPDNAFNITNNLSGVGWGSTPGVDNDLGCWSSALYAGDQGPGRIENSGFTAMIVKRNGTSAAPTLGFKLDGSVDNDANPATPHDGLDHLVTNAGPDWKIVNPTANLDWTIVDSIGVFSEMSVSGQDIGEAMRGRTYGKINFGPEIPGQTYHYNENGVPGSEVFEPNITPDQTYVGVGYEVEMVARWGASTGQAAGDWHITNVTDTTQSGFTNPNNGYRQSGRFHDTGPGIPPELKDDFVETNQFVPYGANITNTIGTANYPSNLSQLPWDYNRNGTVDVLDYVIWRMTVGSTTALAADGNGGRIIEEDDWRFWAGRYGDTLGGFGASAGANAVPEPTALLSAVLAGVFLLCPSRKRQ